MSRPTEILGGGAGILQCRNFPLVKWRGGRKSGRCPHGQWRGCWESIEEQSPAHTPVLSHTRQPVGDTSPNGLVKLDCCFVVCCFFVCCFFVCCFFVCLKFVYLWSDTCQIFAQFGLMSIQNRSESVHWLYLYKLLSWYKLLDNLL